MRKIDRSAFLYMAPRSEANEDSFAQCSTCIFWNRHYITCNIMDMQVLGQDTCALYIEGLEIPMTPFPYVTPLEAGYESRRVRCENCRYGNDTKCELFAMLNRQQPAMFNLDEKIDPYGCCNANTPKDRSTS